MSMLKMTEVDPMRKILEIENLYELNLELNHYRKLREKAEENFLKKVSHFDESSSESDLKALNDAWLDIEVSKGLILTCKNWLSIMRSKLE